MSKLVACVALSMFLAGCAPAPVSRGDGYEMGGDRYGPKPSPDPTRQISDQDCTAQIVTDGGNLRCR